MTLRKTHNLRHAKFSAAIVVAALIASACGGDDTAVPEPTTPTASELTETPTTTTSAPVPVADAESDASSVTTTVHEGGEEVALVPGDVVAASELFPEDDPPNDLLCEIQPDMELSCWTEPEPLVDPETSIALEASEDAVTATTVVPVEVTQEPEPEEAPATTVPEGTSTPTTMPPETTGEASEEAPTTTTPEDAQEPEAAPTTTLPDEQETEESTDESEQPVEEAPEEPQYAVGDIVAASELYPDEDLPDNLFCEIQADGQPTCWTQPSEDTNSPNAGWVPPQAGMVPEPHPECSGNVSTHDENCIPPKIWNEGQFDIGYRVDERPRPTQQVLDFFLVCNSTPYAPCDWLLGLMARPLDYLGARPSCVLGEYLDRVAVFARTGYAVGPPEEQHGWHHCATVIDPLVGQTPTTGSDVGVRLSDTGLTLAERCRAVLPGDVNLETFYGGRRSDGTRRDPIRFDSGHAGCDDWAEWVEAVISANSSDVPTCFRSARLAEEWMEHHHGVHEGYITGDC